MNVTTRWLGRLQVVGCLVAAGLVVAAGESDPPPTQVTKDDKASETPAEYRNWVNVGVGGTFGFGSDPQGKAEYQRRYGLPAGSVFGGVEDFHYEQDVGK